MSAYSSDRRIGAQHAEHVCSAQPGPCWRGPLQDDKLLAEKCRFGLANRMRSEPSDEQSAEQLQEIKHPKARIAHRGIGASPDTIFGSHTGLRSIVIAVGLGLMLGHLATTVIADDALTARRQALEPFFRTYRPSGAGPFPALLFVSGCSGFAPSIAPQAYTRAAESWLSRGYVVVFVDYLAAQH